MAVRMSAVKGRLGHLVSTILGPRCSAFDSPSSVYGTHSDASISSTMPGLGGRCGNQEHCGRDPVANDQALNGDG